MSQINTLHRYLRIPPRFTGLKPLGLLYLGLGFFFRVVLWMSFGRPAGVAPLDIAQALVLGLINDFSVLVVLLLPLTLFLLCISSRIFNSQIGRTGFAIVIFSIIFGFLYSQPVEFFFFEEFDSRFNLIAVDYLMYPHEVLINLWESYPIVWFLLGNFFFSTVIYYFIWPKVAASSFSATNLNLRLRFAALHTAFAVLLILLPGFPEFSANRVANEIASNGINSFFIALQTEELNYDLYYSTMDQTKASKLLRNHLENEEGQFISEAAEELNRHHKFNGTGLGKLNVVVITEESLGAGYVGAYGDKRGFTPNFDRLSTTGMLFKNTYATGTRTVRGLEAISASFPPIPSESIVKRPGNENIANWGQIMRSNGYHSSFIYGGFGLFDNMNYYFGNNGFALSDRTDIQDQTFSNIWGVCDEDLFRHSLKYFDTVSQSGKPFFSIIMTTSNHKPFTFPENIPGVPPKGGGRDAGVRYADYAIGKFFELAPQHSWYDNTVFVIIADHDSRVYGRALVPIERYRIPLLILSPKHIKAAQINKTTSQLDLAPTILGLLGIDYTAPFFGSNVLDDNVAAERPVLVSHNHDVAIFYKNQLGVLGLQKTQRLFAYNPKNNEQREIKPTKRLLNLATAYYQRAFTAFNTGSYILPPQPNALDAHNTAD